MDDTDDLLVLLAVQRCFGVIYEHILMILSNCKIMDIKNWACFGTWRLV